MSLILDLANDTDDLLFHLSYAVLLLPHAELSLIDASVKLVVLLHGEVTCLAILKDLLLLSLLFYFASEVA